MTTLLKSATIIDTSSQYHNQQKDILITNGIIQKISDSIEKRSNYQVIELDNLHVSCGWFDTSVSFGEPGFETCKFSSTKTGYLFGFLSLLEILVMKPFSTKIS